MPRYIDIEPFETETGLTVCHVQTTTHTSDGITVKATRTKDIPSVDVVEVMRCKDCKYFHEWEGSSMGGICEYWTDVWDMPTEPSGFCSYGERRKDDEC